MKGTAPPINMSPGVLADSQVVRLFDEGYINCIHYERPDIDGSAFDLRLGGNAWRIKEAQRPATRELTMIKAHSQPIKPQSDINGKYFLFESGQIYLVELDYLLDLPLNINGRATGKSSVGRLDVITRLLTDESREYDVVEERYKGQLHLLVLPQTFSIKVRPGESLNQLRLFSGLPNASVITQSTIHDFGTRFWHMRDPDQPNDYLSWDTILDTYSKSSTVDPALFDLSVDLADPESQYIYEAIPDKDSPIQPRFIDLRQGANSHDPTIYFKRTNIVVDRTTAAVPLTRNNFYIMKSKERLYIPPDVAVEVIAISERIGDIRIHYAGFAHPGFGREHSLKHGTPLIFEVRATDWNTRLYDGSLLARIQLFRMSTQTKQSDSPYEDQELNLSKVFF